jgi:hypothetical protein
MLKATIKSLSIDRTGSGGISLQVIADIINDSGHPVRFKLLDENGITLESTSTYVATPVQVSKFFYLSRTSFPKSFTSVTIEVEDDTGVKVSDTKTVDTFQIKEISRTTVEEFQWSIRNFSTVPIYSAMEILDDSGNKILNSNEYVKVYGTGYSYYKYIADTLLSNPAGTYKYRLKYYNPSEGWTRYYPDSDGINMLVRENNPPRAVIKKTKIRKETSSFVLSSRLIFSDIDEDDITYVVMDNLGTKLLERTNYTYSPQLEYLTYEYPLVHFNTSRLTITVEVFDKLYGSNKTSETIDLFKIYDFYRERDMFRWKFRNYSNRTISMQVEVHDFYGNLIKTGEIIRERTSFDFIQLQDTTKFLLERDYYKYRLRVWSEDDEWEEFYPFDPFPEEGIQFTTRPHENPVINITEARITRDLDDVKYLILKADITDKEKDQILFQIRDDTGKIIRNARDFIDTPAQLDIKQVYDIIDRTHVNITLAVVDDNSGTASQTVLARAYRIYGLTQEKGHIFRWYVDNYSTQKLSMNIEILKEDEDGNKVPAMESNLYDVYPTLRPRKIEDRLIPKLPVGTYYYRLRIYSETEDWQEYYPNEEGIKFEAEKNNPSVITLESLELGRTEDNKFSVNLKGNITDKDSDLVIYTAKDHLGNLLYDSVNYVETPLQFEIKKTYGIPELDFTRLIVYIDSLDEGQAMTTLTEIINLFEIQNLYRDYDKFYWLFRNYSKIPITMQVEILDSEGYLAGAGSYINVGTQLDYREFREIIDFKHYDDGKYFFRIKLTTANETWVSYYPNLNGLPFEVKQNNPPDITVNEASVAKVGNTAYDLTLKVNIDDKEGDKVYYVVVDDN